MGEYKRKESVRMNCKEFLEHLDAWIDGEVTPAQRQAFLSHAQGCSACRKELRDARPSATRFRR